MHRSSFFLLAVACVLLAVSAAPPLPSNAFEGTTKTTMHSLEELVRHLSRSKAFASLARLLKNIKLQVPPVGCETQGLNLTMDCTSAQTMFNNITTQCPVAYIANSFSDPASLNDTILQDYCSGSCYSQTNLALNQVVHSCWTNGAFDSNSVTSFQDALVAYKVSCIKDTDGSYCTPKWKLFANISAALANGSLSDSSLSQVCSSSCVKNQANTLSEFGQQQRIGSASFGKVLCSQIDGQWCALVYQQAEQDAAQQQQPNTTVPGTNVSLPIGNSSSSANSSLSRWCQPCYRRFVQGAYHSLALGQSSPFLAPFSADQFAPKVNAVSYQCAKDQDGQFCVDKVNNNQAAQNISECGDVFDNINGAAIAAPCSLACVNQLQAQINSLGCCAFTYFQQRLNSSLANGDNPNTPFAYQYIRNVCNISIPNSCSAQQLNFSVVLSNVQEQWANNTDNSQNLQGAMRRDLAARFAVPLSQVALSALAGFPAATVPSTNSSDNGTLPVNGTIPALPVNNATNGTNDVVCVNGTRYVTKGIQAWGYIIPLAAQELDWLQSEFQNATAQNDLSLDETASIIPLEARIDPVSPLMVNQTASNVTIAQNPWGGQSGSVL